MRACGVIVKWDDDRGFGFIRPDRGGPELFVHFSAMRHRHERPRHGARVGFRITVDQARGPQAADVILEAASREPSRRAGLRVLRRRRSAARAIFILLGPAVLLGAVTLAGWRGLVPTWVPITYLSASALSLLAYAVDKYRAIRNRWRISESTLHLLEMCGGWPGAFIGQHVFRHKNRKPSFQIIFWLIVAAHLAFWTWFARQHSP